MSWRLNNSTEVILCDSFDACLPVRSRAKAGGRRRNPTDRTYTDIPEPIMLERGYTGHSLSRSVGKHYDIFNLVDMNSRVYDPVLGRFLGVDPVIQAPENSQSYNGDSYCLNNPTRYSDPNGYSAYNAFTDQDGKYPSLEEQLEEQYGDLSFDFKYLDQSALNRCKDENCSKDEYWYKDGKWYKKVNGEWGEVNYEEVHKNYILPNSEITINFQNNDPDSQDCFDIQLAVNTMIANALNPGNPKYKHECVIALYKALNAGHLVIASFECVYEYKAYFANRKDFKSIQDLKNYTPQVGDIVVFDGNYDHSAGYVAMWCGDQWISDIKQGSWKLFPEYANYGSGFIPYQKNVPTFTIFRYTDNNGY